MCSDDLLGQQTDNINIDSVSSRFEYANNNKSIDYIAHQVIEIGGGYLCRKRLFHIC